MARYFKAEDVTPYLTKYIPSVEAVELSKIDKAIEEIIKLRKHYHNDDYYDCKYEVLEILKKNIG